MATDQLFVSHGVFVNQPHQRVAERERVVSTVQSERELIEVGGKVLDRELMVRDDNGPLEQEPRIRNRVGVDLAPHPIIRRVVLGLMAGVSLGEVGVSLVTVGVDRLRK